jgi:hypothetical protein
VPLKIKSSVDKVPEMFNDPVISVDPVIEKFPFSVIISEILPLSSTTISEKKAPADPLNIMEPLAGSIIMSLLYKGNGICILCC